MRSILPGNAWEQCFGAGTPIDMLPLDPALKPGPNGICDQDKIRAGIWKKPIKEIMASDVVVPFDDKTGNLVPGDVMDGGPVQPLPEHKLELMPRNDPLAFSSAAPSSEMLPDRNPQLSRRRRKATEAKARRAAKRTCGPKVWGCIDSSLALSIYK